MSHTYLRNATVSLLSTANMVYSGDIFLSNSGVFVILSAILFCLLVSLRTG